MSTIEEKWIDSSANCKLCGKARNGERWWEEHCTAGGSGFNFTFCFECDENRRAECDKIIGDCLSGWVNKCREYWATHPEELAKHNKETEEYRKTLKNWK